MSHKVYISFKKEDIDYKRYIQNDLGLDMIDKSLNEPIKSTDENYIMQKIREDYLSESTVTIFLIGSHSSEVEGVKEQKYIKRELQASLYNGKWNTRNGILGIVLPEMYDVIYTGISSCPICGQNHSIINLCDETVIKEFSHNYFIKPLETGKCSWYEEDRYCILVKWCDFIKNAQSAEQYIERAFNKRQQAISSKVIVRP